jgi:hypothetical protein
MKNTRDSRCPDRDSNKAPPEYKSKTLRLSCHSVHRNVGSDYHVITFGRQQMFWVCWFRPRRAGGEYTRQSTDIPTIHGTSFRVFGIITLTDSKKK